MPIQLSEALKDKIRLQSTLKYTDEDPDIELRGTLVEFRNFLGGTTGGGNDCDQPPDHHLAVEVF
ncbi:MAG: hypothetical protein IPO07_30705 [Haliscomenobacter sp.]|nr:hypothetical protein [Haliscomenobacter sp.]MBK9492656.1 hypothetical protein [Haliscomenobacter sp.]